MIARLLELKLPGGAAPYVGGDPATGGNIFAGELPRDFLKDHDLAAQFLALQDRRRWDGRLIGRQRDAAALKYVFTKRRFRREILMRCFLYAPRYADLWGEVGYTGLVEQLDQAIARFRVIADQENNAIRVEPEEAVRPWNSDTEADRQRRRPQLAILRVRFIGGIQTTAEVPIIPSVEITPQVQ